MAQSLNKTVLLNTTGTSYLSIAGKVGKFLVGDQALEFYPDVNVEQFIQIPWDHINQIGANVTGRKISRHFEVFTDRGKFLVGDQALEFYSDRNIEDYIQIPWTSINQIGANVSGRKISRHFEVFTDQGKFLFASKDSGKILKIAREKIGNEKVVKLPTLLQIIGRKIKNLFAKK